MDCISEQRKLIKDVIRVMNKFDKDYLNNRIEFANTHELQKLYFHRLADAFLPEMLFIDSNFNEYRIEYLKCIKNQLCQDYPNLSDERRDVIIKQFKYFYFELQSLYISNAPKETSRNLVQFTDINSRLFLSNKTALRTFRNLQSKIKNQLER